MSNEFLSNEAKQLKTNCEMVCAELTISNARKCQICAYYRPHPNDDISLEPLSQSLSKINPSSKSVIVVGGDFNLGHMDWETLSVFPGKPDQQFLDIINDNSLTQVVNKTTRKDKTLDLNKLPSNSK